jgi:hypothetical protein
MLTALSANSLVYANDAALDFPATPANEALRQFVQQDQLRFMEELQNDMSTDVAGFDGQPSVAKIGNWDNDPPTYAESDWKSTSGSIFGNSFAGIKTTEREQQRANSGQSGFSSTTLTPNTEVEDDRTKTGLPEMKEVNGGMAAWGGVSDTSSETVGGDAMDVSESRRTVNPRDVEMQDVFSSSRSDEPTVQHIEITDPETHRKGG